MATNKEISARAATRGDLGHAVANARVVMLSIMDALEASRDGDQEAFDEAMSRARVFDKHLDDIFEKLVGWTPDEK